VGWSSRKFPFASECSLVFVLSHLLPAASSVCIILSCPHIAIKSDLPILSDYAKMYISAEA